MWMGWAWREVNKLVKSWLKKWGIQDPIQKLEQKEKETKITDHKEMYNNTKTFYKTFNKTSQKLMLQKQFSKYQNINS